MTDHDSSRSRIAWWVRVLALVLLIAGYVAYVRANDAEASAIFAVGGDAGLWSMGTIFAAMLLVPGVVLLLLSLAIRPRTSGSTVVAGLAGVALLVPTVWLAVNLYPPDKHTDEGRPLRPAQWEHVADLHLTAFVLMGAAGALLLLSACRARPGRPARSGG